MAFNQFLADGADKIPMLSRYCSQPFIGNDTADQGGFNDLYVSN